MSASTLPPPRASGVTVWVVLAAFLLLCLSAGWIGSLATIPNIPTWYAGLEKPAFNPPNWVFGPVWTILYIMMGISGWLVWKAPDRVSSRPFIPFAIQLALNLAWSFAFFGAQNPLLGLVVIIPMWICIVWTIVVFWPISRAAALLLAPYLAWVSFATLLNASILALN